MSESDVTITVEAVDDASATLSEIQSSLEDLQDSAGGLGAAGLGAGVADAGDAVDDMGDSVEGANESVMALQSSTEDAGDSMDDAGSSLVVMGSAADDSSESMDQVSESADEAGDSVDDMSDSLVAAGNSSMWSMQGIVGLSGALHMGIADYERMEMMQIRTAAASLAVERAQDTLNTAMQTSTTDNDNAAAALTNVVNAEENYMEAVAKYGANSIQAQQALVALTKAQEENTAAQAAAAQASEKLTLDQQALQVAQERLSYDQERSNLMWVQMGLSVPMMAASVGQLAGGLGNVGAAISGAGGAIADFAGGLTLAGVAGAALVAGVVVAGAAIVGTGISLVMAHQAGESYIQTYSRWAAQVHEAMPGITGDIVAAAGLVSAGLLQMGQDVATKGVPAIEGFAGSVAQGLSGVGGVITGAVGGAVQAVTGFGKSIGQGFQSMFGTGGQVYTDLTQGVGYLQQLWNNIWSPTGTGAGGFPNMSQMVVNALTGAGGLAMQFPTMFTQLASLVTPTLSSFGSTISSAISSAFGGVAGGLGGAGNLLQPLLTSFQQFPTQAMSSLNQISTTVTEAFTRIAAPVTSFAATFTAAFQSAFTAASADVNAFGGAALAAISGAFTAILTEAEAWGNKFISDVQAAVSTALSAFGQIPTLISTTVSVIETGISAVLSALASIPTEITVTINEVLNAAAYLPAVGASSGNVEIPGLQSGGYVAREGIYHLHANEYVIPAAQLPSSRTVAGQQPIALQTTTTFRLDSQVVSRIVQQDMVRRRTHASAYKWS